MEKIILQTIESLLLHKGKTTYNEVASVSGIKKLKTLQVINANSHFLEIKGGKIVGFVDYRLKQLWVAFDQGKTYRLNQRDSSGYDRIDTKNSQGLTLQIEEWYGAYADRYKYSYIEQTQDNIDKLEKMGIVNERHWKVRTIFEDWQE